MVKKILIYILAKVLSSLSDSFILPGADDIFFIVFRSTLIN